MLRRLLTTAIVCLAISLCVLTLSARPSTAQDAAPVIDNPPAAADAPVKDKAARQQPAPDLRDKATIREAAKAMGTAMRLAKAGPSAKTDRAALAQQISQKYLTDAKAAKALTAPQWNTVYRSLSDVVSLEKWGPVIWEAYGDDEKASALLTVYDAKMSEAATRAMLPHMPLPKIVAMMGQMKKAGKDAAATRQIALDHLAQRVTDVDAIKKIKTGGFASVVTELHPTKPDVAVAAAVAWLRGSQAWKDEPVGLCTIIKTLGPAKDEDKQPLAEAVQSAFEDEDVPWRSCADMAEAWGVVKVKTAAAHWAMRAYNAALGTEKAKSAADMTTIVSLSEALEYGGLLAGDDAPGAGYAYAEVADVLVRLARENRIGDNDWRYVCLPGIMLGSKSNISIVQQELLDKDGHLRLPVAKILTWAYRYQFDESLSDWRNQAQHKVDTLDVTGDEKAKWMIMRLYCDRVQGKNPPEDGKDWLATTIAIAESPALKLQVAKDLIAHLQAVYRYDLAMQTLEEATSLISEDTDPEGYKAIKALATSIKAEQETHRQQSIKDLQEAIASVQAQISSAETDQLKRVLEGIRDRYSKDLLALGEPGATVLDPAEDTTNSN